MSPPLLMRSLSLAFVSSALLLAAPSPSQQTGDAATQWLVRLSTRSFSLAPLRDAITERDADRGAALVAEFEQRAVADQAAFASRVADLGGRVLRHWWIVDACHVEASPAVATALRTEPGVVAVEPDLLARAHEVRPHDEFNHGTQYAHALGFDGTSPLQSVLAIMDSGIDVDMNGSGRPHRAFFPGGDSANATGPGIAGSRIVSSARFGLLAADDRHGHGTFAAAIAGGDAWGSPVAAPGHAKGALLASYGIGDQILQDGSIFALYSTMTTAWQQMLADRIHRPIVVANNSFAGEPDPLHTVQQALDAAAWIGDILVCVSAGNDGPAPSTGDQSCCNGIAVAGAAQDTHAVYPFSSRGPVLGDPTRTYPDLTAVSFGRVPVRDCETSADVFVGTSSAAPRVAGAAMILRAAFPTLRADTTKAILLAAAADLDDANPGLGPNAFGAGMLRDDRALLTAADPTRHAFDSLASTSAAKSLGLALAPGQRYRAAVAWMRTSTASTTWSDLRLRVLDGATLSPITVADSPRNLYEVATFVAPAHGFVVAEVTASSIAGTQQEFAIAIADALPTPIRGGFTVEGAGCEGPVASSDPVCAWFNADAAGSDLLELPWANRYENAIELTAPAGGITVTGFELLARGATAGTIEGALFQDDGSGRPLPAAARTATTGIDDIARWRRLEFAPALTIPGGQRYYIGVSGWDKTRFTLDAAAAPQVARIHWRDRCASGAAWAGTFGEHVGVRVLCAGAPRGEVLLHETRGPIRIGETCQAVLERAPRATSTALMLGFSNTSWSGGSLPFDLSWLGGTGCALHVDPFIVVSLTTTGSGDANVPLRIGPDPILIGVEFFTQFVLVEPASPRQVTTSNGGRNLIGRR